MSPVEEMSILRATFVVFLSVSLGATVPLVGDDPMVDLVKEVIFEANQYIAQNHLDRLPLLSIGLPWDPIKLRNGTLGNFSTIELRGTPYVEQQNNPDGSTLVLFDIPLGLDRAGVGYDFEVNILELITRIGTASISTHRDSAEIKGTFLFGPDRQCEATLTRVVFLELGDFDILVQPDDIPEVTAIGQAIINLVTPKLLPLTNSLIKDIISTEPFKTVFSKLVCKMIPI